jgi:hypothetical protein
MTGSTSHKRSYGDKVDLSACTAATASDDDASGAVATAAAAVAAAELTDGDGQLDWECGRDKP